MTVIEIISAFLLIIACVFVVAVVLMQESKQGMSNVLTGGSSDNYYQKNSGRTREAKLARATKAAAIAIFVIALVVNVITINFGGKSDNAVVDSSIADDFDVSFTPSETTADSDAAETTAAPEAETTSAAADTTAAAE